jgi:hypothetical protein
MFGRLFPVLDSLPTDGQVKRLLEGRTPCRLAVTGLGHLGKRSRRPAGGGHLPPSAFVFSPMFLPACAALSAALLAVGWLIARYGL